ncbi:MAG: hypothetical protein INR69_06000 [Mucilaginibacter polytrichastri]|nr:hypothetical protein [Mucilaginibacter polytrichastri]
MTKEAIIEQTLRAIDALPAEKAQEIADFAGFLRKQFEENALSDDIEQITAKGRSFDFLHDEEDLYTLSDLKQVYHGKR